MWLSFWGGMWSLVSMELIFLIGKHLGNLFWIETMTFIALSPSLTHSALCVSVGIWSTALASAASPSIAPVSVSVSLSVSVCFSLSLSGYYTQPLSLFFHLLFCSMFTVLFMQIMIFAFCFSHILCRCLSLSLFCFLSSINKLRSSEFLDPHIGLHLFQRTLCTVVH